jgi:hypothetical protein
MGLNADSFDEETTNLNAMISHMTISLVERPEWAKNLANLDDVSLLEALWTEVQAHEATFHGPRPKKEAGESKGKDE